MDEPLLLIWCRVYPLAAKNEGSPGFRVGSGQVILTRRHMVGETRLQMTATVVLLHGLGRTHRSMGRLRRRLHAEGWETWSVTYPSRRKSIAACADEIARRLERDLPDRPLFAVTHSMGGIVLRHLSDRFDWKGAVLMAPPNRGSRSAVWVNRIPILRGLFGQALGELAVPEGWPSPPSPSMIIAGTRGWSWSSPPSWVLSRADLFSEGEAHDGTVAVEETRHDDVDEHVEIRAGHSTIMSNKDVMDCVVRWLERQR